MGGGNHGRWDGNSNPSTSSIYNEIAQLATSGPPITLTLSSFAVTRKAYGKVGFDKASFFMFVREKTLTCCFW